MNRDQLLLVGLGGAGNRLVDTILGADDRFQGYFINTSNTDLESLEHYNDVTQNYLCISQQNGVGRNKEIGKGYARQYSSTTIDKLMKYQQKYIYLVSSLGGGSGSSILTVNLEALREYKKLGIFDKTVNLICILPDITKSQDIILENTLETWRDMFQYSDVINSIIFIYNGSIPQALSEASLADRENYINQKFTELFDSIFDIPDVNGTNFDNGNLTNVLTDKGCLYIYDLGENKGSIEVALRKAEQESILAEMYNSNLSLAEVDGKVVKKCGYIGLSLNDPNYNADELLRGYKVNKESYIGYNEEKNLLLISGCLPPNSTIELIQLELEERAKNKMNEDNNVFASTFAVQIPKVKKEAAPINNQFNECSVGSANNAPAASPSKAKLMKKVLKKNVFNIK